MTKIINISKYMHIYVYMHMYMYPHIHNQACDQLSYPDICKRMYVYLITSIEL
jgi:hypothetical protein